MINTKIFVREYYFTIRAVPNYVEMSCYSQTYPFREFRTIFRSAGIRKLRSTVLGQRLRAVRRPPTI